MSDHIDVDSELDELLDYFNDAIRQTCGDCNHPVCLATIKVFRKQLLSLIASQRKEAELAGRIDEVQSALQFKGKALVHGVLIDDFSGSQSIDPSILETRLTGLQAQANISKDGK